MFTFTGGRALHKNKGNREKFRWLIVNSQLLILNYLTKDTEHQFGIYNLEFTIFPFFIFVQISGGRALQALLL
jgi:hypothetical protein